MRFRAKNTFYLRISLTTVVPLYLYLDDKHIQWMSERILNVLLEDLRQAFQSEDEGLLLRNGLKGVKTDVTIRKRDIYQFAYFFRKSQPHSVLFKTRTFMEDSASKGKGRTTVETGVDDNDVAANEDEDEEQKPKLKMHVSFKGLTVTERCLCIIIEPRTNDTTDELRQVTLDETITRIQNRSTSIVPQREQQKQREKTPLFLPDPDLDDRTTPALSMANSVPQRSSSEFEFESVLDRRHPNLFPEEENDRSGEDFLRGFGETLNSIQDGMVGDVDDDDGDEGEAFLGDADERKGAL